MNKQPNLWRRLDNTHLLMIAARLVLGGLFIYMGLNKALAPIDFLKLVREYHMVAEHPPLLLNTLSASLPWLEVFCGVLLITGVALRGTALLLLAMLVGFTVVVTLRALNIYNSLPIAFCDIKFDCGCGAGEEWICEKVPKNIGLCLLSAIVLLSRSRKLCLRGDLLRTARAQ